MSLGFDQLSVRDFSASGFTDKNSLPAHATAHTSGLPLLDDEIAFWPDGVDVFHDRYAKRVVTISKSKRTSILWVPLFNRPGLLAYHALSPAIYLSDASVSAHGLRQGHRSSLLDLNGLVVASNDPFLRAIGVPVSDRNPYLKWKRKGTTFYIDTVSMLELVVARDEPLFRLLLSPFRDAGVRVHATGNLLSILWADDRVLASRGGDSRSIGLSKCYSFEMATCIAYWLGSPDGRSELSLCADSLRRGTTPHLPRIENSIMASVHGYERGKNFLVNAIQPLALTPQWPCNWGAITVLNRREGKGRVMAVPKAWRQKNGTLWRRAAKFRNLDSIEAEGMIRSFGRSSI